MPNNFQRLFGLTTDSSANDAFEKAYIRYLRNCRQVPDSRLREKFERLFQSDNQEHALTPGEKQHILARKLWTDVVSETQQHNSQFLKHHDVKADIVTRLRALGYIEGTEKLYEECLHLLRHQSVLTLTFNELGLIYKKISTTMGLHS